MKFKNRKRKVCVCVCVCEGSDPAFEKSGMASRKKQHLTKGLKNDSNLLGGKGHSWQTQQHVSRLRGRCSWERDNRSKWPQHRVYPVGEAQRPAGPSQGRACKGVCKVHTVDVKIARAESQNTPECQ